HTLHRSSFPTRRSSDLMKDWLRREPIVIVEGEGAVLRDVHGSEYLDANSSIWTNLHGHNHPKINASIQRQLKKLSHSSALGLAKDRKSTRLNSSHRTIS